MLGVEAISPRNSAMSTRPDLQPHPPAILPVDTLAPRPKQPQMYSRARARPGQTVEVSSRKIEAASVASLSASVQSIEGRVASARALRATSPLTRVLQAQHSPAPTQRQKRSNKSGGKLPPVGRAKEDEEFAAEPVEPLATLESEETVEESALRLGVLQGSGLSIPDMRGLKKEEKSGPSGTKRNFPDSALASAWLDEVVSYGLAEIGDPNKGLTQEFEDMGVNVDSRGVARLGVAHDQLREAGLLEKDIDRIYRALYVYSVGFHEMVQEVVGTGQKSARAVVNVLRTFNFVSEVIQRTSFTNNLVNIMLENESNTARIAALQAEIAREKAMQDDQGTDLEVQEKMYDDAMMELLRYRKEKEAMEKQLESVQALMDALSLPGGEIYRLKLLLEEAQTSKHEVVTQARQQIAELEAMLRNEKNQHKRLQEAFRKYRDEITDDMKQKEREWELERQAKDNKIRWLGDEMDKLRTELDARNKQIPELEERIETEVKNARVQQLALKGVIEDLRKEVKDVKKKSIEEQRVIIEEKNVALVKKEEAVIRADTMDMELKTTKSSLEETSAYNEKLQDDIAELGNSYAAVKTNLVNTESKLSVSLATSKELRQEIEDLREQMAKQEAQLKQEIQDWKDKEAATKEKGEKKYQKEKEKAEKMIASKDDQLKKLRDTVKNGKLQLQELRDQLAQMKKSWEDDVAKFEKKVAKLEKMLQNRDAAIKKQEEDKANLSATVKKLKKDIEKLKSKAKKDLANQKEDYEAQLTDLSMQINKLTKQLQQAEQEKAAAEAALERLGEDFAKAREMVVLNLQNFNKQLAKKEKQLEEQSQLKINHQQSQIENLSSTVDHLESYRQRLVRQRETLRQNLIRNAQELQLAQEETEDVRTEVEQLKMQIKKLEMYLRRYRERFQSADVGCQAGLDVVMEDKVHAIELLTQELKDGATDAETPLQMMELAMQLVEILEEAASLPKGSVSRFFRIAIDEYDAHEDQVKQHVVATNMRYDTVGQENKIIREKRETVKRDLLATETMLRAAEAEAVELRAEIKRGPPELVTLAQAAEDAKKDASAWKKRYEAATASFAAIAQSTAQRIRDKDLRGAHDYHKLLQQCDANTPITQELLSDIEAEVSANAELTAQELVSAADDIIEKCNEDGVNVDVAEKAMDEMSTMRRSVATVEEEKDELAIQVKEITSEQAKFIEEVAAAKHDPSGAGIPSYQHDGAPSGYAEGLSVDLHPVGVYASWHERRPRAAQTWNDITLMIDKVPDSKPMSVDSVHAAILGIYMEKVHTELIQGKKASNMCDFTVVTFEDRFGLADLAETKLLSFIAGIRKHRQATLRIKLFNQFCRLDPSDESATAISRGAQAQEYFLNVLHSLHGFIGRDDVNITMGPLQTTSKLGTTGGSLDHTGAQEDFGWATRWLASPQANLTGADNAHAPVEAGKAASKNIGTRVMVPLDIVKTVGSSVFAAEAAGVVPKILQYIEADASTISGGARSADLDVVLMAFMRVWEEGIVRRLASMQGLFVTAKGRNTQLSVPFGREVGEVKAMLTAHNWNPAVAALSTAVSAASDEAEAGGTTGHDTARRLNKALQTTNLLLSKTIQLLARQQEGSASWSAYQLLMDGLQSVAKAAQAPSSGV